VHSLPFYVRILQFNTRFWIILNLRIVPLNIQGTALTVLRENILVRRSVKHQLRIQTKLLILNKSVRWVPFQLGTARLTFLNDGGGRHLWS